MPRGLIRDHSGRFFKRFTDVIVDIASALKVGNGLQDGVQMGPVISDASKARIEGLIRKGPSAGRESDSRRSRSEH